MECAYAVDWSTIANASTHAETEGIFSETPLQDLSFERVLSLPVNLAFQIDGSELRPLLLPLKYLPFWLDALNRLSLSRVVFVDIYFFCE